MTESPQPQCLIKRGSCGLDSVIGAAGLLRRQRRSQDVPLLVPFLDPVAIPEKTPGNRHILSCLLNPRQIVVGMAACCTSVKLLNKTQKNISTAPLGQLA